MTVPPLRNAGLLPASSSSVMLPLMPSSLASSPLDVVTGTSSAAKRPASRAAAARWCDRSANSSCRSRVMPYRSATFSAVSPRLIGGYISCMRGLTRRQPSRVSAVSRLRAHGSPLRCTTNGARVMDSVPPATATSMSPAAIARAASLTASMPDPHSRLTVAPGISTGRAGQQHGHAGHVPVVLARLVRGAPVDVVDGGHVKARGARDEGLEYVRGQVVGADLGQRPLDLADRRPAGIHDEYRAHADLPLHVTSIFSHHKTRGGSGRRPLRRPLCGALRAEHCAELRAVGCYEVVTPGCALRRNLPAVPDVSLGVHASRDVKFPVLIEIARRILLSAVIRTLGLGRRDDRRIRPLRGRDQHS